MKCDARQRPTKINSHEHRSDVGPGHGGQKAPRKCVQQVRPHEPAGVPDHHDAGEAAGYGCRLRSEAIFSRFLVSHPVPIADDAAVVRRRGCGAGRGREGLRKRTDRHQSERCTSQLSSKGCVAWHRTGCTGNNRANHP